MIFEPMVCSGQTVHLSCIRIITISKWTEMRFHMGLVTLDYHRVHLKWFLSQGYFRHILCTCLAPALTWSSNRPKRDSTWPTSDFHRLRPKWFLSLWYVRRKLCTNLASRLALSPNGLKWDSTRPKSARSFIMRVQNNFWACGMFGANRAPILHRY
jgi:hypothetical protein